MDVDIEAMLVRVDSFDVEKGVEACVKFGSPESPDARRKLRKFEGRPVREED